MADYSKLVQETENIELRSLSSFALDELLLVKRAISFFETLKRISVCLRQGVGRSAPGMMDTQQLSLYQLTSALASVDPKVCADPIKFFLANASAISCLRAAMKGGRWGADEAAEVMIQCADRIEKNRKEVGFSSDWLGSLEDQSVPLRERLGIGLEHVGRNIRKLDYAREILGGSWRRNNSATDQRGEMKENDLSYRSGDGVADSQGLSSMLYTTSAHGSASSKTKQLGMTHQEFEFQYMSLLPLLLSFLTQLISSY
jgi:hypothetical protein